MLFSKIHFCALFVTFFPGNYAVEVQQHERWPRQALSSAVTPRASTATLETVSSLVFDTSSIPPSATPSKARSVSAIATSPQPVPAAKTSAVANLTAHLSNTTNISPDALPLEPRITPALSVAGVILILTGAVYAIIGVKNSVVQISISAAYLIALAITVLLVYVCSPPISPVTQGAYFVAAFAPAVILGAAALKFTDFTEGLGCLLGGFTFSMWILVLKTDGTITSTGGKVIFITVFCAAAFALFFSRYTRSYGLMTCTSFSGATAIVLGIDCFSRAGLKEFWLWIWALNENLFPLLAVTYPVTRGIQVEIAAIIFLTVFGVISQLKLWQTIQERNQKTAIGGVDEKQPKDQVDGDSSRRLEEGNGGNSSRWRLPFMEPQSTRRQQIEASLESGRDSAEFMRAHNNFSNTLKPGTASSPDIELDELEAHNVRATRMAHAHEWIDKNPAVRVNMVRNETFDEISQVSSPNDRYGPSDSGQWFSQQPQQMTIPELDSQNHASGSGNGILSLQSQIALLSRNVDDDTSSLTNIASSNHPQAKKKSGFSLRRTLSVRSRDSGRNSLNVPTRNDSLTYRTARYVDSTARVATREENRRESEGLIGGSPDISPPLSQSPSQSLLSKPLPATPGNFVQVTNDGARSAIAGEESDRHSYDRGGNQVAQKSRKDSTTANIPEEIKEIYRNSRHSILGGKQPSVLVSALEAPIRRSSVDSLTSRLPEQEHKVATVYRTNEWAKHLDPADIPISDSPNDSDSEYSKASGPSSQRPALLNAKALQQKPLNAQQEPEPFEFGRTSYEEPRSPSTIPRTFLAEYTNSLQKSPPVTQQHSYEALPSSRTIFPKLPPVDESSALISRKPVPRVQTPNSLRGRSSSSPLVVSPIEEPIGISFSPPPASPPPTAHSSPLTTALIAKRDILLRSTHPRGSSSLSISTTPTELSRPIYPDDSASMIHSRPSSLDDDDMSLSQRRSILREQKHQTRHSHQQPPPNLGPAVAYQPPPRSFTDPTSTARREAMLSAWRTSLQQDFAAEKIGGLEVEAGRAAMLTEKYKRDLAAQRGLAQKKKDMEIREKVMLERGNLGSAHREVLRRMQGEANRRLSSEER